MRSLLSAAGCAVALAAHAQPPALEPSVRLLVRDFATAQPLANFNYLINLDNTKLPVVEVSQDAAKKGSTPQPPKGKKK